MINRPNILDGSPYYVKYIDKAPEKDLVQSLRKVGHLTVDLIGKLSEEQSNHRYEENKWSVKQVIRHLTDTERVFAYRALCFSRKDGAELPGFDENKFVALDNTNDITFEAVRHEFIYQRKSTIAMFATMASSGLDFEGTASRVIMTPRTIGWSISGHNVHHLDVLKERYFKT